MKVFHLHNVPLGKYCHNAAKAGMVEVVKSRVGGEGVASLNTASWVIAHNVMPPCVRGWRSTAWWRCRSRGCRCCRTRPPGSRVWGLRVIYQVLSPWCSSRWRCDSRAWSAASWRRWTGRPASPRQCPAWPIRGEDWGHVISSAPITAHLAYRPSPANSTCEGPT